MIKCFMLCRDHRTRTLSVSGKKDWFEFRDGWYNLDRKYGLHEENYTAYYYLEGNPQPINCQEDSISFLETIGFKSLMAQFQGNSLSPWGEALLEYIKNPGKIFSLGLILILLALITQAVIPI